MKDGKEERSRGGEGGRNIYRYVERERERERWKACEGRKTALHGEGQTWVEKSRREEPKQRLEGWEWCLWGFGEKDEPLIPVSTNSTVLPKKPLQGDPGGSQTCTF